MTGDIPDHASKIIGIDDLIVQVECLPSLPAIVMDLLASIDDDNLDMTLLARKVAHEQGLTAMALKFANSSFYGNNTRITTIQQAITLLGVTHMRNLITTAALSGCFPQSHCAGFDFKAFWRHSMATAICAKVLARHLRLNQDIAFTAGLLHDIGRVALVVRFPRHYEQAIAYRAERDCQMLDAERSILGVDHVMAGHLLARHWNFPTAVRRAISSHHEPDAIGSGSIASLVNVANAIAHALDLSGEEDDLVPTVSLSAWHAVGLDAVTYMQVFRETELQFNEMRQVL